MHDKHQVTEEPCEFKGSCTVLQTSGAGDSLAEFNRSTQDVQKKLFHNLRSQSNGITKSILELDIEKCFDQINHRFLMSQISLPPQAKLSLYG